MSDSGAAVGAARWMGSCVQRAWRAWRITPHESRLAAYAALGLCGSLFLPWYQRTFFVVVAGRARPASDSLTGWGAFSFVEAALLLVALGVLTLLFQRAEGRAFHLPGGDGWVITAAGFWACVLIVWRIFDKQSASSSGAEVTSYGVEWGIFVALGVAAFLAYAGSRIRAAQRPEPPLPAADGGARQRSDRSGQIRSDRGTRPRSQHSTRPGADRGPQPRSGSIARPRPDGGARPRSDRTTRSVDGSTRAARERHPPRPAAARPGDAGSPAFDSPPEWSGGDVPTFDTQRRAAGHAAPAAQPPAPGDTPPDLHEQPTMPLERAGGGAGASERR